MKKNQKHKIRNRQFEILKKSYINRTLEFCNKP